jgi:chemotaxis signal transduction protein
MSSSQAHSDATPSAPSSNATTSVGNDSGENQRRTAASGPRSDFGMPKGLVCFTLAGRSYGIDVALVREVVNVEGLLAVPKAPAPIVGAFALRGATVALVDARILFGLHSPSERQQALIIARSHQVVCAMTIDKVLGVVPFNTSRFTAAVRGQDPASVAGFISDEQNATTTVLDTANLIRALEKLRF